MITFLVSFVALILGYTVYGRFVEHVFAPDDRPTPAVAQADGIDYVAMPYWKVFMIQFLNIAGTGPIFGAIMGAKFGPSAYLWIVFGCIFAGATHDYLSVCCRCAMAEPTFHLLYRNILAVLHPRYCWCLLCSCC